MFRSLSPRATAGAVSRRHLTIGIVFALAVLLWSSCEKSESTAGTGAPMATGGRAKPSGNRGGLQPGDRVGNALEFQGRIGRLQRAELESLWASLESAGLSQEEKRDRHCQIIERLTEIGAYDTALKLVSGFGPGELRASLVFSLFSKSPEPVTKLLERMKDPVFSEGDRNTLLRAIARNVGGPGGLAKVTDLLASKPDLSREEANAIASGIGASIDLGEMGLQFYQDPAVPHGKLSPAEVHANYLAADAALKAAGEAYPELRDNLLNAFLVQAGEVAPFDCWKTFLEHQEVLGGLHRAERLDDLAEAMFTEDPRKALAAVEEIREPRDRVALLRAGATAWARYDLNAAEAWFSDSSSGLAPNEADQVAHGISRFLAEDYRPREGWKWVNMIADPEARRKAEGQVWQREKVMVSAEAGEDPRQLVESIVSGSSQHAPYWIEIGMNEWIARDAAAAAKWYEAKGSSLTPLQNEAVALAYARLALRKGDTAGAARWAGQVVTPKFKVKIETEIKQAGNEGG
jgi:hypothetical protein